MAPACGIPHNPRRNDSFTCPHDDGVQYSVGALFDVLVGLPDHSLLILTQRDGARCCSRCLLVVALGLAIIEVIHFDRLVDRLVPVCGAQSGELPEE